MSFNSLGSSIIYQEQSRLYNTDIPKSICDDCKEKYHKGGSSLDMKEFCKDCRLKVYELKEQSEDRKNERIGKAYGGILLFMGGLWILAVTYNKLFQ